MDSVRNIIRPVVKGIQKQVTFDSDKYIGRPIWSATFHKTYKPIEGEVIRYCLPLYTNPSTS